MKTHKHSVLIVDDSTDNILLLRGILHHDYKIHFATDGVSALALASSLLPDIILLDIVMPGMGGYEVCSRLKENALTREIPVIFISALSDEENETMGFDVGGVDYISKPLRSQTVKSRIFTHLALRQATRLTEERNAALQQTVLIREEMDRITNQDMREPVARILSTTETLQSEAALNEQEREMVHRIHGSALHLLEMINASLNLHKIEAGVYVLDPREMDLVLVINRILQEQEPLAHAKCLTLRVLDDQGQDARVGSFVVMGEALLCHSLFGNLLVLAMEHAPLYSTVTVTMTISTQEIITSIHHPGQLPLAIRERFFDKYLTVDKHSGIGAYASRLIARLHAGELVMETGPTAGTFFHVRLPKGHGPPLPGREQTTCRHEFSQESYTGSGNIINHSKSSLFATRETPKILIVDDQLENIHLLQSALKRVGEVYFAINGEDALEMAIKHNPDLILLDVLMPGMDGYATIVKLRQERATADIPVVFVTAMDHKEGEEMGLKLGAIDYITKPFRAQSVRLRVQNILELKRLRDFYARLSLLDGLTGIANRRRFDEALDLEWRRGLRSGKPLSLLMMDVDHFKLYNDHYGHTVGDECLRRLAKTIASCMERPGDTAARYGGEEFVCLLPETSAEGLATIANKIQRVLEELALPHPVSPTGRHITLSMGGATLIPLPEMQAITLVGYADTNLYRAKAEGRNRFVQETPA